MTHSVIYAWRDTGDALLVEQLEGDVGVLGAVMSIETAGYNVHSAVDIQVSRRTSTPHPSAVAQGELVLYFIPTV